MSETLEDLGRNGFKIIQPSTGFRFGMDSVLLADFARVRRGDRVADLCAGCAAISLMIAAREERCLIEAVEIDEYMARLALKNVEINRLENRMTVSNMDVRDYAASRRGAFSLVVCNPPYFDGDGSAAKHLTRLTLEDLARAASALLPERGRGCFVFPAARLMELTRHLQDARLEPKKIRCVQHSPDKLPKIILIEAIKNASPGLTWLPAL
ncbi:MAG: methyltransferase, partial [Clostridia bacterium]|nr:methyltransferase [Clostridia bacterium]